VKKESWDSSTENAKTLRIDDFGAPDKVREMAKMPLAVSSFAEARVILDGYIRLRQ